VKTPSLRALVRKEARAVWPVWAATAGVCLAAGVVNEPQWVMPSYLAYFVGSVALAALAIGHEYNHGTLPALLSLPVNRRRLILAKLLAVLPMIVTLAPLALTIAPRTLQSERGTVDIALSLFAAVAIAPWLTMLCRSPLAGSVFAIGVAGGLHLVSLGALIAYVKLAGLPGMPLQVFGDRVLAGLLVGSALVGAICGWRRFMTLEALDGRAADLTWPRWLRSSMVLDEEKLVRPLRRSSPAWLLVKKELRLQHMSIAVAMINVLIWFSARGFVGSSAESDPVLDTVIVLYGGLIAIVIGALASAEERHLGTLAWQTLLPVAAWRQFAVKVAVAMTLSLLLAFVLPVALARGELSFRWLHAAGMLVLTIGGLFVSSACRSGLQALTVSAPALFVCAVLFGWSIEFARIGPGTAVTVMASLVGVALWFAFVNHRTVR
jgi:hypothetical protein